MEQADAMKVPFDAEEGRQERIQERMREQLEAAFSKDDPDEASPEERRTGREIKDIAAMIWEKC